MDKPTATQRTHSNRKQFIALGIAVALLIVVIVGFMLVLQSPERQLASGFANFIKADSIAVKGTVSSSSTSGIGGGGTFTWNVDAKTNKKVATATAELKYAGKSGKSLNGTMQAIVVDQNTVYVKINDPAKFMSSFADVITNPTASSGAGAASSTAITDSVRTMMQQIGTNMQDKWIKISSDQFKSMFGENTTGTDCYAKFADTIKSNSKARGDLAGAYAKHQFVKINSNLPADGASKGYRVTIDPAKLKEFRDSVAANEAVKQLGTCGDGILTLGAGDSLNDQSADIWVNRFSHEITRIKYDKLNSTGTSAADLRFDYNVGVTAEVPQQTIELQKVFPGFM